MKGVIGPEVAAAVLIAIAVLSWGMSLITEGRFQPGSGAADKLSECEYNSDCGGELCISVEGGDYYCGCLQQTDCGSKRCIDNDCV